VVINLFIAVVINNLDEAKAERLAELQGPVTQKEILTDLRETQKALTRLERRLDRIF
jgi:voltage-gated sodium channel